MIAEKGSRTIKREERGIRKGTWERVDDRRKGRELQQEVIHALPHSPPYLMLRSFDRAVILSCQHLTAEIYLTQLVSRGSVVTRPSKCNNSMSQPISSPSKSQSKGSNSVSKTRCSRDPPRPALCPNHHPLSSLYCKSSASITRCTKSLSVPRLATLICYSWGFMEMCIWSRNSEDSMGEEVGD